MSEWISVKDRLPEKQADYICRCVFTGKSDYAFFMVLEFYPSLKKPQFQHEAIGHIRVTHWTYLPEFPGEKGGKDND